MKIDTKELLKNYDKNAEKERNIYISSLFNLAMIKPIVNKYNLILWLPPLTNGIYLSHAINNKDNIDNKDMCHIANKIFEEIDEILQLETLNYEINNKNNTYELYGLMANNEICILSVSFENSNCTLEYKEELKKVKTPIIKCL